MQAYRMTAWQEPPELVDVAVPEPGPGEALVKVTGSGACHSDLHLMEWPVGPWPVPFTLGHEPAGVVEALGDGADGVGVGDVVGVYGPTSCGTCARCRADTENYCERTGELGSAGVGLGLDGGMAGYVVAPARHLVPLGPLDPAEAAPLVDAALTPYHAIKRSLDVLVPGSTTVVIGIGGLGHMAVQILRAVTATRIVAVDTAPDKLDLARSLGADEAVEPSAARGPADLVLDFVGSDDTLALVPGLVRPLSHVTIVGIALGALPVGFARLPYEVSVATTYWGSLGEYREVIALAQRGDVKAHVQRFGLGRVAEAYDAMRAGELRGRAVIVP